MPGGQLSFGIYQRLGGQRNFGSFWLELGIPTVIAVAACYYAMVTLQKGTQKAWLIGSVCVIASLAAAVNARMLH